MTVLFSPWGNQQFFDENGDPATGWKIYTYAAGSSTPLATYTDSTGGTSQTNPIVLNSLGFVDSPIWLTSGLAYKLVLTNAADVVKGPPEDNITGVTGAVSVSQWQASGITPTYVNATSFTLPGDQTTAFHVGRRLETTNTGGTYQSTISSSVYGALTTVTVVNDSGVLDAGLSAVSYGLLTATSPSIPSNLSKLTSINILPGYLYGCGLSTAGSSSTMSIAAGRVTDSTGLQSMALSAIAKTTAAWSVGTAAGGLDTGAIANSTWYHFYVIRRPDTGVVDVVFSTNATTPTLPANYTQYRRIGSGKTNGSAQWTSFIQDGDDFQWLSPVLDVSASAPGAAAVTRTLSTPLGVNTVAKINIKLDLTGGGDGVYLSDLATTDLTASFTASPLMQVSGNGTHNPSGQVSIRTNTASQIRSRMQAGSASNILYVATTGWVDSRGRTS